MLQVQKQKYLGTVQNVAQLVAVVRIRIRTAASPKVVAQVVLVGVHLEALWTHVGGGLSVF